MYLQQDQYIHELTINTILTVLKKNPWEVASQSITSAITNDNDLKEPNTQWMIMGENTAGINAFYDIKFDRTVKRILDVGGGKFDCNRHYMKREKNIELLVWDPYNRSKTHNDQIQVEVEDQKVDAATSMSVLNVIPEPAVRLAHISTLKAALAIGGKAYFKIWPGEQPLQGTYLPSATDNAYQANAYADRFLREIEIVFGTGNVKLDDKVPNLLVAIKLTEAHTSRHTIACIQKKSANDLALLTEIRERSISTLYAKDNIFKLFSTNLSFFKKMEEMLIEQNRHSNTRLQDEYDKRYGLVPKCFL